MPDRPTIDVTTHEDEIGGGGGGGGNELSVTGTDYSVAAPVDDTFYLASATDSNVVISCAGNTITFGVYYV